MALNTYKNTKKVSDDILAAFFASEDILNYANNELATEFVAGQRRIGVTVQVRKKARYNTFSASADKTGAFNLQSDNIQEDTESLTVTDLIYTGINLNGVERALKLGDKQAYMKEFVIPASQAIRKEVINRIYDDFYRRTYYYSGSSGSVINSHQVISNGVAVMSDLQMPSEKHLCISPRDRSQIVPTLGAYLNKEASNNALTKGKVLGIDEYDSVSWNESIRKKQAGTASGKSGLTLSSDAVNGATNLTIAGVVAAETLNVGAVITFTDTDVKPLSPVDKKPVDPAVYQMSYVVAPDNTGTNPIFSNPTGVPGDNNYDPLEGVYTSAGATMTVSIDDQVRSGTGSTPEDHFRNVQTPSNKLNAGAKLAIQSDHRANMAITMGGISIASPPVELIENSTFSISNHKGLSMFIGRQGDLFPRFTNDTIVGLLFGVKVHPEYCMRQISGA